MNAAGLEAVTLGSGAVLGRQAFYNACSLKSIDLSKVKEIGDYAVSGDVYYACLDENMSVAAVSPEGTYVYTYHGPLVESVDLSSAEKIGKYSFSYCRNLVEVKLGSEIKSIPEYAFAGCASIKNINLENIEKINAYAFMECGFEEIDLSATKEISEYAFVSNRLLASVKLGENPTVIGEGAFSYCDPLANIENLASVEKIGDYAFAYTAITEADLTGAVSIGKNAFLKENVTEFKVTLGEKLSYLGDNPFAMCVVEPFFRNIKEEIDGHELDAISYTFDISDTVKVIDGSLYYKNVNGYELITYAGVNNADVTVAEDTVRISALAFAGSGVERIKLPYTVTAIGHKAFFACDALEIVIFGSYNVPIFEEEFDPAYYDSLEHIPGSGDYGTYTDYNGNEVAINGMGLVPYFMWNVTGSMYSNIFYGANFVDYVGYVEEKLIMVHPVNGVGYDSYICDMYFDYRIEGPAAPDKITVAAINAIKLIPERVTYEDKAIVEAARAAYNKIATLEQMALVTNYSELVSAEQRIAALAPETDDTDTTTEGSGAGGVIAVILLAILAFIGFIVYRNRKEKN